jgi:chloramphenicol 3-O-phosphotransferase
LNTSRETETGEIIFLEGVPSSGKTSVARELAKRVSELRIVDGDAEIRRLGKRRARPLGPLQMFERLLEVVEKARQADDVVVDVPLPGSYVLKARQRFPDALFVSLRITEDERVAREKVRKRKRPLVWNQEIADAQGSEDLFDLVIDATDKTPAQLAEVILEHFESENSEPD